MIYKTTFEMSSYAGSVVEMNEMRCKPLERLERV